MLGLPDVLPDVATSATVTGLLVWIGRLSAGEWIKGQVKSRFDERLETHKATLKEVGDSAVERLKS